MIAEVEDDYSAVELDNAQPFKTHLMSHIPVGTESDVEEDDYKDHSS